MTLKLAHKVVTFLFAALGFAALTLGAAFSWVHVAVIAAAGIASWFAEEPLLSRPGYSRFWTVASVAILLVQFARIFTGAALLDLGVEYAAFLQLSKLAHRKTAADHQQIALLGFLHLIAGTVLSSGLEYGVVFVGFLIVMPWMLALTHIRRELELRHGTDPRKLRGHLRSRSIATPSFFAGTTLLALPLFAITATFFFAFPRVGFGYFSKFGARAQQVAGFGEDVKLGGFGAIRDDPSVIMRIQYDNMPNPPPPSLEIRLRGTSFDKYQAGHWTRSKGRSLPVPRNGEEYPMVRPLRDSDWKYTVILDAIDEPVLFLPEGTVALTIKPTIHAGQERHRRIFYEAGFDFRYRGQVEGALSYEAYVDPALEGYAERMSPRDLRRYTDLPSGYQRVRALAHEVIGNAQDAATKAARIKAFLQTSGKYSYTTTQPDTTGRDPLSVFLFEAKAGHCEYFSTAMAVMLRSIGVPARNVTGFLGADFNPYGGYYAVRNGNAHSWVEALINGRWVTFDPTPSRGVATPSGILTRVGQVVDALRIRWAEYVVEYSVRDQAKALSRMAKWYRSLRTNDDKGTAQPEEPGKPAARNFQARRLVFLFLPLLVIGLILRWLWSRGRSQGKQRPLTRAQQHAQALYVTLEESMRKAGQPRPRGRTPIEHVEFLRKEGFDRVDAVNEVTAAYLEARFGERAIAPAQLADLRKKAVSVRKGSRL